MIELEINAKEFTKLLIEICGIYQVGEDGWICNCNNHYLANNLTYKKNSNSIKIYKIRQCEVSSDDIYITFNPFQDCLYGTMAHDWLCQHLENVCACLTKKIIWTIINGILTHGNETIKKQYNGILLEDKYIDKLDMEMLNNIRTLPEEYFLSLDCDKYIVTATSKLFSSEAKNEFSSFKSTTWEILENIFRKIFYQHAYVESRIPPIIENVYYGNRIKSEDKLGLHTLFLQQNVKLQVFINLLGKLKNWASLILGYELNVDILFTHFSRLEDYRKYFHFSGNTDRGFVTLIDKDYKQYSPDSSYDKFLDDIIPTVDKSNEARNFIAHSLSINPITLSPPTNSVALSLPINPNGVIQSRKMPVANYDLPQTFLSQCELGKNAQAMHLPDDIESYIVDTAVNYNSPSKRDYEAEIQDIMLNKINLRLLMTLEDPKELQKWLPGTTVNGNHLSYKGAAVNLEEYLHNRNAIQPILAKYSYSMWPVIPHPIDSANNFLALYATINGCVNSDRVLDYNLTVNTLLKKFEINKNNVYKPIDLSNCSSWQSSDDVNIFYRPLSPETRSILFRSETGSVIYSLIRFEIGGITKILPITNWVKNHENPANFFVMPNKEELPLLNLDYISKNPHARIILTEDIELAYKHGTEYVQEGIIWTSWYGRDIAIERVDWKILKGRKIYYLCKNIDSESEISITLKILKEFNKLHAYLHIMGIDKSGNGKKYKHKEFLDLAKQRKVHIPEELQHKFIGDIDANRTEGHHAQYLIDFIIETDTISMIYAPSGIGKTWLSLSIALAVANGVDIFNEWKNSASPKGVAYFAGEMKQETLEDRIMTLNKIYKKSNNEYLLAKLFGNIDLATPDGQRIADDVINTFTKENDIKISLLILDNLNTLAETAITGNGWEKLFNWLQKKKGITTIIIHHPNKEGKYLGTSKIINRLDLMIYAGDKDDIMIKLAKLFKDEESKIKELLRPILSNDIAMFVSPSGGKQRLGSKSELKPFWLSLLDLNGDTHWQITHPDYNKLLAGYNYSLEDFSKMLKDEYCTNTFPPENFKQSKISQGSVQSPEKEPLPKGNDFIDLAKEKQAEIIKMLYQEPTDGKMTGENMAIILGISKRKLDYIRKDTGTLDRDFKNGKTG